MPKAHLVELSARSLGVIEDASVEFGEGFNVLTGETGAGKTLLLGALELCLGFENAPRAALTTDTRVAAVFQRPDGSETALIREAGSSGRLRCSIDGGASSAEGLRQVGRELVVINGQHDSLRLRQRGEVLRLVDAAGHIDTTELQNVRAAIASAERLRTELGGDPDARRRAGDLAAFQLAELRDAQIDDTTELETALAALSQLTELREGQEALGAAIEELDGDHDAAALTRLAAIVEGLPQGLAYDSARTSLRDALTLAREAVRELTALADPDAVSPSALAALETRVSQLSTLARKYGGSLAAALAERERLATYVADWSVAEERAATLADEIDALYARESDLARAARRDREFAAARLTEAVRSQLPRVALPSASLRFTIEGDDGADAQIMFTPNPGLPEGPLSAMASGGELSRVLLALSLETVPEDVVAVYDEVDAGVGGQTAQQIGVCLAEVATRQQVLAITHLASVAARANHHFVIEKVVDGSRTVTTVRKVEGDERVREIARMLAGDDQAAEALSLARRLLAGE